MAVIFPVTTLQRLLTVAILSTLSCVVEEPLIAGSRRGRQVCSGSGDWTERAGRHVSTRCGQRCSRVDYPEAIGCAPISGDLMRYASGARMQL